MVDWVNPWEVHSKSLSGWAALLILNPNSGIWEQPGWIGGGIGVKKGSGHLETVNLALKVLLLIQFRILTQLEKLLKTQDFDSTLETFYITLDCVSVWESLEKDLTEMTWPQMRRESFLVMRLAKSTSGGLRARWLVDLGTHYCIDNK